MNIHRQINAAIKTEFKSNPAFVPAKADMIGSFPSIRFEGDLPVSLAFAIARFVECKFPQFTRPFGRPTNHIFGFVNNGTTINWAD